MTAQPALWRDDWATEPCDHADPDEQAHADLHADRIIPGDHGRPASRRTHNRFRHIDDVEIEGDLL
ncbi:hypothetical protein [Streptomyces sp. NPDC127040]|uniref:hypothetical protein n=1 Tax=Streptomyces sp. NPDC127040 TaxID=3347116 RepID=UPI003654A0E8